MSNKSSGFTGEKFPELFDINAMPKQKKPLKTGQLAEQQIRDYFEKGYLMIDKYFTSDELEPCKVAIEEAVDNLAQKLYNAGKIKDLHNDCGLFQRLTNIEEDFPGASVIIHKLGKLPKAFRDLMSNERLLNMMEQLIGPNISGFSGWNLRSKTPHNPAMDVPWHQALKVRCHWTDLHVFRLQMILYCLCYSPRGRLIDCCGAYSKWDPCGVTCKMNNSN